MNPFSSRTQTTIPIPFDPPHTVTIRKLPGRHLQRAALENQFAAVSRFRKLGGSQFQKELEAIGDKDARAKAVTKAQADPLNGFDPYILMQYGIVAWTYEESLAPVVVVDEESALVVEATQKILAAIDKAGSLTDAVSSLLAAAKTTKRTIPALEDLDDEAVEFFAREVLKLSKPALFQTPAEAEAAQKNA